MTGIVWNVATAKSRNIDLEGITE